MDIQYIHTSTHLCTHNPSFSFVRLVGLCFSICVYALFSFIFAIRSLRLCDGSHWWERLFSVRCICWHICFPHFYGIFFQIIIVGFVVCACAAFSRSFLAARIIIRLCVFSSFLLNISRLNLRYRTSLSVNVHSCSSLYATEHFFTGAVVSSSIYLFQYVRFVLFCFCNPNYLTKNKWNLCTQNAFTDHFKTDWSDKYKRVLANWRVIYLVEEHFWFTKTTFKNIDLTNIEHSTKPHRSDLCWFQFMRIHLSLFLVLIMTSAYSSIVNKNFVRFLIEFNAIIFTRNQH